MQSWLFKSEPDTFSIDDLSHRPNKTEPWDGVRNYQARNMLRDDIQVGDNVFFYHSSCATPGIVGIAKVTRSGYPDQTAMNPESKYYDPKSTTDNPRWFRVDITLVQKFKRIITLEAIKNHPFLQDMIITRKGSRLSITPITQQQWGIIIKMSQPALS